eukprot:1160377-Pelagomonas_calceolata.AAC.12
MLPITQEFEFQQSRWDEELRACHEQIEQLQEQLRQGQQVAWGSSTQLAFTALLGLLWDGHPIVSWQAIACGLASQACIPIEHAQKRSHGQLPAC